MEKRSLDWFSRHVGHRIYRINGPSSSEKEEGFIVIRRGNHIQFLLDGQDELGYRYSDKPLPPCNN